MTTYRDRLNAGIYQPTSPEATVPELKQKLKAKGLPVSGTKEELIARLNETE